MVTRKITRAAGTWAKGDRTKIKLGNLQARRDWGFAGDYVKAMHLMLQQPEPKDYVIGTGESHSVAEFVTGVLSELQNLVGGGDFSGHIQEFVEVDSRLVRTNEISDLRADPTLALKELGWQPTVDFYALIRMMVAADLAAAQGHLNRNVLCTAGPLVANV
jgi:GDPmannose 4,6-dehydratase